LFYFILFATSHIGGVGVYVKTVLYAADWIGINNGKCEYIIGALYGLWTPKSKY